MMPPEFCDVIDDSLFVWIKHGSVHPVARRLLPPVEEARFLFWWHAANDGEGHAAGDVMTVT